MASWTDQDVNTLLPGEPWTSAKALAAFENPEALAEGASSAPHLHTQWHYYNQTVVGGSGDGIFYSHAVDGAVATATTPAFEDGYEYGIVFEDISVTTGSPDLTINFNWEGGGTSGAFAIANAISAPTIYHGGFAEFPYCRTPNYLKEVKWITGLAPSGGAANSVDAFDTNVLKEVAASAVVGLSTATTFDSGIMRLVRRRVYI
jgi:hypothetical protein